MGRTVKAIFLLVVVSLAAFGRAPARPSSDEVELEVIRDVKPARQRGIAASPESDLEWLPVNASLGGTEFLERIPNSPRKAPVKKRTSVPLLQ